MEIKPQDLRVGNLVIANGLHEGKVMTVEGIDRQGTLSPESRVIIFKEHHVGEFIKDIKGIELTPEWLERFGFEKEVIEIGGPAIGELSDEWSLCGYKFMFDTIGKIYLTGYNWNTMHMRFVHQLQNLYFALTGEELAIDKQTSNGN